MDKPRLNIIRHLSLNVLDVFLDTQPVGAMLLAKTGVVYLKVEPMMWINPGGQYIGNADLSFRFRNREFALMIPDSAESGRLGP